jgi:hypothetical protein
MTYADPTGSSCGPKGEPATVWQTFSCAGERLNPLGPNP